jgi:MFS family permease
MSNNNVNTPLLLRPSTQKVYRYSLIAAVGGFVCGYDTGSISSILALPIFQHYFYKTKSTAYYESLLLASYLVTSMMGALMSGYFCGK